MGLVRSLPDLRENSGRKRCTKIDKEKKEDLVWTGAQDGGTKHRINEKKKAWGMMGTVLTKF